MSDHTSETIIILIEGEDTAQVFTHKPAWMKYFKTQCIKPVRVSECGGADYVIPKKWVLCPRNRSRAMTDEQRAVVAKRMKRVRKKLL